MNEFMKKLRQTTFSQHAKSEVHVGRLPRDHRVAKTQEGVFWILFVFLGAHKYYASTSSKESC